MPLPAALLRELLVKLRTDSVRRRASDKRTAPRVGLRTRIQLLPASPVPWPDPAVWVRDLSAKGVGLLTSAPLPAGTEFVIPFDRTDDALPPVRLLYRTTHTARVAPGLFSVGGRLICVVEPLHNRGAA